MGAGTRTVLLAVAVAATGGASFADVSLELVDGRTIHGTDVERRDGFYRLTLESGGVVPIDETLVRQVRLTGEAERPTDAPAVTATPPRALAGRITRLSTPPPSTLAGREAELPRTGEQLAAFGREPARFRDGVFDPWWRPTSDWTLDLANNEFNPARWYVAPIDPVWVPTPAYTLETDVTEFNPARWFEAPIDPVWEPGDGFADSPADRRAP